MSTDTLTLSPAPASRNYDASSTISVVIGRIFVLCGAYNASSGQNWVYGTNTVSEYIPYTFQTLMPKMETPRSYPYICCDGEYIYATHGLYLSGHSNYSTDEYTTVHTIMRYNLNSGEMTTTNISSFSEKYNITQIVNDYPAPCYCYNGIIYYIGLRNSIATLYRLILETNAMGFTNATNVPIYSESPVNCAEDNRNRIWCCEKSTTNAIVIGKGSTTFTTLTNIFKTTRSHICSNSDGSRLYAMHYASNTIEIIDPSKNAWVATIETKALPSVIGTAMFMCGSSIIMFGYGLRIDGEK